MWPNHPYWKALQAGSSTIGEHHYVFRIIECGNLILPSGRLVACDPFADMQKGGNPFVSVPPGTYPVKVTLVDASRAEGAPDIREAYASLLLSEAPEQKRQVLPILGEGEQIPNLKEGEYAGFGVDTGTACFVDDEALKYGMPDASTWYDALFENTDPQCWFSQMDDPEHIGVGVANIALPLAANGENLILFHSGWGDGYYPVIGGYDAMGRLVAIHIDFFIIDEPEDVA